MQDCIKFRECIALQSFLVNNLADVPDTVQVKNSKFGSVVGGVSLQQHLLLRRDQGTRLIMQAASSNHSHEIVRILIS